jgi:hypothetical protein
MSLKRVVVFRESYDLNSANIPNKRPSVSG